VRTLLDDSPNEAGRHAESWDGREDAARSLATGVYFCPADADGKHREGMVVLLK
jgi:hypothetical protein